MTTDKILLGSVNGVFGVKGWIKVYSYTRPKENILDYSHWFIADKSFKILQKKTQGKGLIALLDGVNQRNLAEALVGCDVGVERTKMPPIQADEYYWTDLIGLDVVNLSGTSLGRIDSLFETGANDVLVVKGERERLIPLVFEHVVVKVDLKSNTMTVDWDSDF